MAKITVETVSENTPASHSGRSSSATHSVLQKSTTLSRKYVRKPAAANKLAATKTVRTMSPAKTAPARSTKKPAAPATAKAAKECAVKSALRSVATIDAAEEPSEPIRFKKAKKIPRLILAVVCSAATVFTLATFIHFNMPDISVKVAAMQNGLEANVPTYTPRGYQLRDVSSEKDGNITMSFENNNGGYFTLSESKSTWDSTALLNNYVKENYSADYATLREQGITIYIDNKNATWVNGGLLYEISAEGQALTKEQIRNLVVSL